MFLDRIPNWYRKYRDPCNRCLVGVVCRSHSTCDRWQAYRKRFDMIDNITDVFTSVLIIGIIIIICVLIILTFIFGIWKWVELLNPLISTIWNIITERWF